MQALGRGGGHSPICQQPTNQTHSVGGRVKGRWTHGELVKRAGSLDAHRGGGNSQEIPTGEERWRLISEEPPGGRGPRELPSDPQWDLGSEKDPL